MYSGISFYFFNLLEVDDDSEVYRNETSVGRAIRESGLPREDLYITTKWSFGEIKDAISTSLTQVSLFSL